MTAVFPYQPIAPIPDTGTIKTMSPEAIAKVRRLEGDLLKHYQIDLPVQHTLHGGIYTRTLWAPAGVPFTSALLKVPTTLIIWGTVDAFFDNYIGAVRFEGYNVIAASAGRKCAFYPITDVFLSASFRTDAKTKEEAEAEATDEWIATGLPVTNVTGE